VYRDGDGLVVSATDLVDFLECGHLTSLSLARSTASGRVAAVDDPGLDVLRSRGLEHEAAYLDALRAEGLSVVEISGFATDRAALRDAARMTRDALDAGVDVVYQATFFDERDPAIAWRGHADFLRRVESPYEGRPRYEPEDTKLAERVKPSAVLQLCSYAEQLAVLQGSEPEHIHVVLRGQARASVRLADVASYYRTARRRFLHAVRPGAADETYPDPVAHCEICNWSEQCAEQRRADDHLILVAGLGRDQIRKLTVAGIGTRTELAASDDSVAVRGMSRGVLDGLRAQARLQLTHEAAPDLPPPYELLPPSGPDRGLEALPPPSPGDLYFDMEGDPFVGDVGLEYLFGVGWVDDAGAFAFRAFWAHDDAEEKRAFEAFIAFVAERRAVHPELHVYHYASYEQTALGTLMGRHGTREDEVDDLFRARVLVDLYRVVRQGLRIGSESYSLKKLEPLYMESRTDAITDAASSIAEYERWLEEGDRQILDDIEAYNRVDCESTLLLHRWLEERRADVEAKFALALARRSTPAVGAEPEEDEELSELERQLADLTERLTGEGARPDEDADPDGYARWVLANLLEWHRREDKPAWWRYFDIIDGYEPGDLVDDTECIGDLTYVGEVGTVKSSVLHEYRFDPDQEYRIAVGTPVYDPMTERRRMAGDAETTRTPGKVVELDSRDGTIVLRRSRTTTAPHPTALMPDEFVPSKVLKQAIQRVAEAVATAGMDAPGELRAVRDLLRRVPPRIAGVASGAPLRQAGEDTLHAATRLMKGLDDSYLAIQGPPGTGKTFTAAHAIVDLVVSGRRVGITANSHAVITNLLAKTMEAADKRGERVSALQKKEDGGCLHDRVTVTNDNAEIETALIAGSVDIVAGTPWLFAREGLQGTLDHLVIDEAGQLSLANVVAVAGAARNLVLVGDPQQLAQPSRGTHPPGAGVSGLEHVLHGRPTIPHDHGLFLDTTWRMNPEVCRYISELAYDDRLTSRPECAQQRIVGPEPLGGSGLRWLPVEHTGNRLSSEEEAGQVRACYDELLARHLVDQHGKRRRITFDDLLVVAPYNAQVHLLSQHLPPDARVGTVDKFQGQEGAVVIVSLAASSAEDIPRGLEFLFSTNRLNVAVSRARALAIVVASPSLLAVHCRSVQQMRLVNGLCRFAELAPEPANGRP
jgi:uncharacterized protein